VGGRASRVLQSKSRPEQRLRAAINVAVALKATASGASRRAQRAPTSPMIVEVDKTVGKIVYNSKNRGNWKNEYATKLCKDQIVENAEFAILSTNKFAKDQRELCTFEDVILASPARVLVLAGIFRRQIVINHGLRISAVERDKKSAGRCQTKCWRRLCAW
jgi:Uncharacterized protein conserved in bacteria (DUF2130)